MPYYGQYDQAVLPSWSDFFNMMAVLGEMKQTRRANTLEDERLAREKETRGRVEALGRTLSAGMKPQPQQRYEMPGENAPALRLPVFGTPPLPTMPPLEVMAAPGAGGAGAPGQIEPSMATPIPVQGQQGPQLWPLVSQMREPGVQQFETTQPSPYDAQRAAYTSDPLTYLQAFGGAPAEPKSRYEQIGDKLYEIPASGQPRLVVGPEPKEPKVEKFPGLVRPGEAGSWTKVITTRPDGSQETRWVEEYVTPQGSNVVAREERDPNGALRTAFYNVNPDGNVTFTGWGNPVSGDIPTALQTRYDLALKKYGDFGDKLASLDDQIELATYGGVDQAGNIIKPDKEQAELLRANLQRIMDGGEEAALKTELSTAAEEIDAHRRGGGGGGDAKPQGWSDENWEEYQVWLKQYGAKDTPVNKADYARQKGISQ